MEVLTGLILVNEQFGKNLGALCGKQGEYGSCSLHSCNPFFPIKTYVYRVSTIGGSVVEWVCALFYEGGDPNSIPGSGGTTDWLFSAGW